MLVRNDPTGIAVGEPAVDCLQDVEVVQDIIQTAVVGQSLEERAHSVFGGHSSVNNPRMRSSIRPALQPAKFFSRALVQQARQYDFGESERLTSGVIAG